jgi:hypothetical protein
VSENSKASSSEIERGDNVKGSKNTKGAARAKYNRRRKWLAHALEQMNIAIDDLLAQEGTIYKRKEVENLREAIADFCKATGLEAETLEPPTQEELDRFMEVLSSAKPWEPAPKADLVELYATLGLHYHDHGDPEDHNDEPEEAPDR